MEATKLWGCHSQPRYSGYWGQSLVPSTNKKSAPFLDYVWIEDKATKECQYRKETPEDPRCIGCTCL